MRCWSCDGQFFSGQACYTPKLPCDPTQIGRFRRVLGEAGVEELLSQTITTAVKAGAVGREALKRRQAVEPVIGHMKDSGMGRC